MQFHPVAESGLGEAPITVTIQSARYPTPALSSTAIKKECISQMTDVRGGVGATQATMQLLDQAPTW